MLILEAETLTGERLEFEVWEVESSYPDDDVLYVEGVFAPQAVKLSTVRPVGMAGIESALALLVQSVEKEPCPYCDATGLWDLAREKMCPYCGGSKETTAVNLPLLERAWQMAQRIAATAAKPKAEMNLCQCGQVKLSTDRLCPACEDDAAPELDNED